LKWTTLTWHPGTGLKGKFLDLFAGFRAVMALRGQGYGRIVTLGSVAGTYAYLYALVLRMKLFMYQYEPHSEYALDNGMWAPESLQYKISNLLEYRAAKFASVIASGTRFMQQRLESEWRVKAKFFKIPTVVNDRKFLFNDSIRQQTRQELGLASDAKVLFYPGKFGSLYYRAETAWMYRWLKQFDPKLHFLIVTPHTDEEVHAIFKEAGLNSSEYSIVHCDYEQIHRYYFAADFAVIAVPPGPSKQFISNIKVGEYLCAGLPFLITRGVSEDYWFAENKQVGVVVDDFVQPEVEKAWPKIKSYLDMDPGVRREHCRTEGVAYRGFESLNPVFKQAMQALIQA
jgi:hypothetical protein